MSTNPRVWTYPPAPPGPEVAALTDRYGRRWLRFGDYWELEERRLTNWQHLLSWPALLENMAPLTDATDALRGQVGASARRGAEGAPITEGDPK